MLGLIKQSEIVEQAIQLFLQKHPCFYSFAREMLPLVSKHPQLLVQNQQLTTCLALRGEQVSNKVTLHLIDNNKNGQNCIVYLHGLASYCLEGKFLLPHLGNSFSLCLFDSRSHGKNEAPFVTYGLLEAMDLREVVRFLVGRKYKKIILWGRSMGAVACLRAIQQFGDDPAMKCVKYVVADSAFGSFRMAATEQIAKLASLPHFLSELLAGAFAGRIQQKYGIELDRITLQKFNSKVPVSFFHSTNDQMMGPKHIEIVTNNYTGRKDVIDTKLLHNQERPSWVVLRAMAKIHAALREHKPEKENWHKKGLSIAKINNHKFLSVVTPSGLDSKTRKSMRLVPLQKLHRKSEYRHQAKQNSDSQRPLRSMLDPMLKKSYIFSQGPISSSAIIRLGTPCSKSRKNTASNSFL